MVFSRRDEVELALSDFSRFRDNWTLATPEEKYDILRSMIDRIYLDMEFGQLTEIVPKPGFKHVLEGAELRNRARTYCPISL